MSQLIFQRNVAATEKSLLITETFYSIQGEGSYVGKTCIFIRLKGCNLRCTWCDTTYSFHNGKAMTISEIMSHIDQYQCDTVEITGGEPLLQKNVYHLMKELISQGKKVLLETSGSISIEEVPEEVHIVLDMKAPGSGEVEKNDYHNLKLMKPTDDLKIVISHEDDFKWVEDQYKNSWPQLTSKIFLQPSFHEMPAADLAELIKQSRIDFNLSLQLHKFIYSPEAQGV